jgi:hypothetical protein
MGGRYPPAGSFPGARPDGTSHVAAAAADPALADAGLEIRKNPAFPLLDFRYNETIS